MGYSIQRKLSRDQRKQFLLALLNQALILKDWAEIGRIKEELDSMLKMDAIGFVIRSRFKQNAEEEKASIFHAAKEISNAKKSVSCLRINGVVEYDAVSIDEEVLRYFYALFNGHSGRPKHATARPLVGAHCKLPGSPSA